MKFRKIELAVKPLIEAVLATSKRNDSTLGFANLYSLQDKYASSFCIEDDTFYLRMENRVPGVVAYFPPIGPKDSALAGVELLESAVAKGEPALLVNVSLDESKRIEALPNASSFNIQGNRDYAEYLYHTDDIATYSTPELGRKRRAVRKFFTQYEDRFEVAVLDDANKDAARAFQEAWYVHNGSYRKGTHSLDLEHRRIMNDFDHYDELGLEGLVVSIDGEVAGYAYGALLPGGAFDVIVLKGDLRHQSIWSVILQEVAKSVQGRATLLNLEEDLGIAGLRENKMRFHPCALLDKFEVSLI